jgi:hypothetical protein
MTLPEPIRSFWYAMEELNPHARRTHWGIVVSDPRFPRVYDANKACVLEADPDLTMEDIRSELLPVLDEGGIAFEHVEFMDLDEDCRALQELADRAGRIEVDVLMVHAGDGAVSPDLRAPQDGLEVLTPVLPWTGQSTINCCTSRHSVHDLRQIPCAGSRAAHIQDYNE